MFQALGLCGQAKKANEQWNSEQAEYGGKKEGEIPWESFQIRQYFFPDSMHLRLLILILLRLDEANSNPSLL